MLCWCYFSCLWTLKCRLRLHACTHTHIHTQSKSLVHFFSSAKTGVMFHIDIYIVVRNLLSSRCCVLNVFKDMSLTAAKWQQLLLNNQWHTVLCYGKYRETAMGNGWVRGLLIVPCLLSKAGKKLSVNRKLLKRLGKGIASPH